MKKKILLVMDKPNWAYDQMADFVTSELSHKYDFYKEYQIQRPETWKSKVLYLKFLLEKYYHRKVTGECYDLVIYMWWKSKVLLPNLTTKKNVIGIYTEGFPPGLNKELEGISHEVFFEKFLAPCNGILAGNRNIKNYYDSIGWKTFYAPGAVDIKKFVDIDEGESSDGLKVCWTGNPNRHFKGYFDFVIPAVEMAKKERSGIKLVTRFSGPMNTLPVFYNDVDVMINPSIGDAGPAFIIQAGGCGVPTISVDAGVASELIEDYKNGLFVKRNVRCIADKIIEIYDDRALLKKLSKQISADVHKKWNEKACAKHWEFMIDAVLDNYDDENLNE